MKPLGLGIQRFFRISNALFLFFAIASVIGIAMGATFFELQTNNNLRLHGYMQKYSIASTQVS